MEPNLKQTSVAADPRWQMRLVITLPVLLVLVSIGYGLVSYLAFEAYWDQFVRSGMGELAGRLLRVHLCAMIGLALVAAAMGLVLANAILKPIRAIADATRQIAGGRLDLEPTRLPAAAELEDLSSSFDDMLRRLRASVAERNRQLMAGIPIGAITTDPAGRINAVSPQAAAILNLPEEALIGHRLAEVGDVLPAATRQVMTGILEQLVSHAEDREFTVEAAGAGVRVSSTWLRDSRQEPYGRLLCFRPAAPMRDLSAHLSRTDQLAALGTFCLGLAHELRNPLGAIKGLSQLLQHERGISPTAHEYVTRMVGEVDRVDRFIGRLLELTGESADTPRLTTVEEIVRLARHHAEREVPAERRAGIAVRALIAPGLPRVRVQAERVGQALGRLVQNAYEAAPEGSTITLTAVLAGEGIELRVRNAAAIAAGDRDRLFEPFFTTRDRASGLGLTIARRVIAQNGGALDAEIADDNVTLVLQLPVEPSERRAPAEEARR
ncbi:MAG: ATP-binding protein [Candidatus Sumerlaeia bacterium]